MKRKVTYTFLELEAVKETSAIYHVQLAFLNDCLFFANFLNAEIYLSNHIELWQNGNVNYFGNLTDLYDWLISKVKELKQIGQ